VKPPIIYNLFPRLVGPTTRWPEHALRARDMGFNWIYLNPWHYPGFSGSLYAPKEFDRLNPLFLPPGADERSLEPLREFLVEARALGLPVMMDLLVNHTSRDSPLAAQHPSWFRRTPQGELVSPFAVDPDDPNIITVWGDLAEVDNAAAPDRWALWEFWAGIVANALDLGFAGFRCDAAYMVPAELWRFLIGRAKEMRPETVFFGETLGAGEDQVLALREAGFDYFFNSRKWWDFEAPCALEQHERFGRIAPSISFPETHDTNRLSEDTGDDEAVQRQRYAFAAAFSAGVMMPIGYEFGFRRKLDVVHTMPSHWERRIFDLRDFISTVNRLKLASPLLQGEGELMPISEPEQAVLLLERRSEAVDNPGVIIVNKDLRDTQEVDFASLPLDRTGMSLHRVCRTGYAPASVPDRLTLSRAEVAYLLPPEDVWRSRLVQAIV
jgi:starch synthase (maltosyl-transferring)